MLAAVPPERLLVVRTHELGQSLSRVAGLLGVPRETLSAEGSHANRRRKDAGLLEAVSREYLASLVERYGGDLVARYFPGLRSGVGSQSG
jgi:hypothetical protein